MLLYWRKGNIQFTTDVEDWMAEQNFTEVFRYRGTPTPDEMAITAELDIILAFVRFGKAGIKDTLNRIASSKSVMISGRRPGLGEQSRGQAEGSAVDLVFKNYLTTALSGRLSHWTNTLRCTPPGVRGADVVSDTLRVAWDVTTVNDVWDHVERDVFGKRRTGRARIGDLWDRYYLLVWDDPRTNRTSTVEAIERGRLA